MDRQKEFVLKKLDIKESDIRRDLPVEEEEKEKEEEEETKEGGEISTGEDPF